MKRTKVRRQIRSKGKVDGSPRYPVDQFPVYHNTYNLLAKKSSVLNDEKRANDFKNASALFNLEECQSTLAELVGNKDGYHLDDDNWFKSLIPVAKQNLREVLLKYRRWQKEQVKKGFALKTPTNWTPELLEERLKAEALLDVRMAEKAKVEQRMKQLENQKKIVHKKQILPNGPLGKIGGTKDEITLADGQDVSYSESGIPYINEPDSPYHEMPIVTYREMCHQWKVDMGITIEQLQERRNKMYEEGLNNARLEGREPIVKRIPVTPSRIPDWIKRLGIGKDDWPQWADGAKTIHELELQTRRRK